ncbi:family 20 glycosylhydrolase, partial [Promicromonospora sp. NPDC023987]|uniref:family 20 glycosylhydrolase n=1 Tax=Promicromonospora sp. NPDC023987 TaxID=3155360 RepID=UPI0033CF546F
MTDGADVLPVVPLPRTVWRHAGVLALHGLVEVDVDPGLWPHVRAAAEPLGFVPSSGGVPRGSRPVGVLRVDPELGAEVFRIAVQPTGVAVTGGDPAGVFRGLTVLRQLLPPAFGFVRGTRPAELPCVEIEDAPGSGWRGFMLDVARWFVEVDEILRLIDLMALLRLNVLHLHLTDDQGWRLQVDAWPRLTEVGAWRVGTTRRPPPRVDGAGGVGGGDGAR